jgi:hypothetical protein
MDVLKQQLSHGRRTARSAIDHGVYGSIAALFVRAALPYRHELGVRGVTVVIGNGTVLAVPFPFGVQAAATTKSFARAMLWASRAERLWLGRRSTLSTSFGGSSPAAILMEAWMTRTQGLVTTGWSRSCCRT